MTQPPDDRGLDLRALFFETAGEVLQAINEAGLALELRPGDADVIAELRRAVHTLKGDSAACGFKGLSELAHELEDFLAPNVCGALGAQLADLVLLAADTFGNMLAAYQKNEPPITGEALRGMVRDLREAPGIMTDREGPASTNSRIFDWTEYEQLMMSEAVHRGEVVYNVALRIDQSSPMQAAASQLIRNVLHECGTVIALRPEDNSAWKPIEMVQAAIATTRSQDWLDSRCRIPSIVSELRVERVEIHETSDHQILGEMRGSAGLTLRAADSEGETSPTEPAKALPTTSAAAILAESTLRVDANRIDAVLNLVGELILSKSMLNRALVELTQRSARDPLRAKFSEAIAFQSRVLSELHKSVLKIRMVPAEQLFRRFPRVVRDVAKQCGKDVALEVTGQNTELDKGVLDALAEPLIHVVRNAVDHGIEPPEDRIAAGKPARGTIRLSAYYHGAQAVIEVRDDGRGIDPTRIRQRAVEKGMLNADQAERLSDSEATDLIFEPGFSTATQVTEVSGRGVGMDVVRAVMDRLKGSVRVAPAKDGGTRIQLRSPLTLASVQTLLFRVGARVLAVPLSAVSEIARVNESEISRVDQREVLRLRDEVLTVVRFSRATQIHTVDPPRGPKKNRSFAVVIGAAEKRFSLLVDSLLGEEELVIKALPTDIIAGDLVSGGSILGDGTVVLILNVSALLARLSRLTPLEAIA
jgi:two-component system chemotaxis sensor kinase CheA